LLLVSRAELERKALLPGVVDVPVLACSFSPDGSRLVWADARGEVAAEDVDKLVRSGSASDTYKGSVCMEGEAYVRDGPGELPRRVIPKDVTSAAAYWDRDRARVLLGRENGEVLLWREEGDSLELLLRDDSAAITACAVSVQGMLAWGTRSGGVGIASQSEAGRGESVLLHHAPVRSCAFAPSGCRLATTAADNAVLVHDLLEAEDGGGIGARTVAAYPLSAAGARLSWMPSGRCLLAGTQDGEVYVLELAGANGESLRTG